MTELRVSLKGEEARLGAVPASDVARLILGVERAMARAASVVLGRPKITTGRYDEVIERAVRLKLRSVEEGSVVPVMELPDALASEGGTLDLDVPSLGESALESLLDAADPGQRPHHVVANALLELADALRIGERYESITFDVHAGLRRRETRVDAGTRSSLRAYVESAPATPARPDAVVGVLVAADFEKGSARLRTPTQPAVVVSFTDDLDDDVYGALRQRTTLEGEVAYDPKTHVARSVSLRSVTRGEQLMLGVDTHEYWRASSLEDLAREQGAGAPIHPNSFRDVDASDRERDAFMAALAEL